MGEHVDDIFIPDALPEVRRSVGMTLTEKERKLFKIYATEKHMPVAKLMRVCVRAVMLLEYKKANSLEEAMRKATLLDLDGRSK